MEPESARWDGVEVASFGGGGGVRVPHLPTPLHCSPALRLDVRSHLTTHKRGSFT